MKATFIFISENRNLKIEQKIEFQNNNFQLGYGFNSKMNNVKTYEPGIGIEKYRLHSSIKPIKGDKLIHKKSNRTFIFGDKSGFVCYEIELLEDEKIVGKLFFEDYYKD